MSFFSGILYAKFFDRGVSQLAITVCSPKVTKLVIIYIILNESMYMQIAS